jgi:hypothetical protein
METGEDWLCRPAVRGMLRLESLLDGTLSLEDVAMANDALDVVDENEYRLNEAMKP